MKIIVDGDACPVKTEIIETARKFQTSVCMVASFDHRLPDVEDVEMIQVDRSDQSADMYIANYVKRGDLVITQDFGLACIVMAKHAITISFRGEQYTDDNIDYLLERRAESAKRRRQGMRSKGPKPFSDEDRKRFQQKLTKLLRN
ncbi:MAG: YaiI/YqxD family protein [Candidatus Pristimantibacillus lignocellulolyticus]|uniref:UPF0178 protein NAG76_21210 n=1 Tax=Candidatus Pristimantibacillus lignocellulolyticus TaxID=2994561 RepID=A0A9J6ZE24_9BACL|nr:MAG: YaiI/YqxD family protein [Candidatus Pristimantibacillus lignocellulolyticus]